MAKLRWSADRDKLLVKNRDLDSYQLAKILKVTAQAVLIRKSRLGLTKKKSYYSDDEIEYLKNNFSTKSQQEMALFLGRSIASINGTLFRLKLKKRNFLSKDEYLKEAKDIAKNNGGKCTSSVYLNSQKKLTFVCKRGHKFKMSHNSVKSSGRWCPKCAHEAFGERLKIPVEEIVKRIEKLHGGQITLDVSTYTETNAKARFIDKDYGEWWAWVASILAGTRNPARGHKNSSKKRIVSIDKVKNRIKEIHGDTVVLDESTYKDVKSKGKFIDKDYGEWWCTVDSVINGSQSGHRKRGTIKAMGSMKYTIDEVKDKIKKIHGDTIILDESTYTEFNSKTGNKKYKARFIDKDYGEFWNWPARVCNGVCHPKRSAKNREEACMKKYGVPHPSQNVEIALKIAKKTTGSISKRHWKTKKILVCIGSYEARAVDYLNKNRIDFKWQPKAFAIPPHIFKTELGRAATYRPDFYLVKERKWVEIKGYMREDGKIKWDWFLSVHPTAELWDYGKLRALKII